MMTPVRNIRPKSTAFDLSGLYFRYPHIMEQFIQLANAPTAWLERPQERMSRGDIC